MHPQKKNMHSIASTRKTWAQMGGMGFVHYNNTIEEQAQHVLRVKRHRLGFDIKPIVLPPTATIMQMDLLRVRATLVLRVLAVSNVL